MMVGQKLLPWSQKAREILSDGEWHRFDQVQEEAGKLIPPGEAMRKREHDRLRSQVRSARLRGQREGTGLRPDVSAQFAVDTGRRAIMRSLLRPGKATAYECKDVDGQTWIRLKESYR